jgi:hypothetical protein
MTESLTAVRDDGIQLTAEQRRRRRARSIAIAVALAVLVSLFYALTVVKLAQGPLTRPVPLTELDK